MSSGYKNNAEVECPACLRIVNVYPERQMLTHRPYTDRRKAPVDQVGKDCVGSGRTVARTREVLASGKPVDSGRTWMPSGS